MNLTPETRFSLIARLHDPSDSDAWSEFVEIYQPLIHRIVSKRGLQYADAVEVTQEVLSRVAKAIERWQPDPELGSFRGWLHRVTRNLTVDHIRRRAKSSAYSAGNDVDIEQLENPGESESREFRFEYERQLFKWATGRLKSSFKPENWKAFWLTAVEGKSVDEVAKQLGMNRGAIYVARSRIVARLAKEIEKRLDDSQADSFETR